MKDGLLDSCLRWKRRASANIEQFWLPASALPEADQRRPPSSPLRPNQARQGGYPEIHTRCRGAVARRLLKLFKWPPPCIWIRNQANEDIIVVVSKFGPFRTLGGAELNGSPAGGGIKIDVDTFHVGATKKTIHPASIVGERNATAQFPLWSAFAKAGVVSVYSAADGTVCIENDKVIAGSLAIYNGGANMHIYNYWGEKYESGPPSMDISPIATRTKSGRVVSEHNSASSSFKNKLDTVVGQIDKIDPCASSKDNGHAVVQTEIGQHTDQEQIQSEKGSIRDSGVATFEPVAKRRASSELTLPPDLRGHTSLNKVNI